MNSFIESVETFICYSLLNLLTDLWLAHEPQTKMQWNWSDQAFELLGLAQREIHLGFHMIYHQKCIVNFVRVLSLQMRIFSPF